MFQVIGIVVWLGLGTLQVVAEVAGFQYWLGINWVAALILALVTAYIPGVGTVLGMIGAINAWGWSWWQAGLLFFGGFAFSVAVGSLGAVFESVSRTRQA